MPNRLRRELDRQRDRAVRGHVRIEIADECDPRRPHAWFLCAMEVKAWRAVRQNAFPPGAAWHNGPDATGSNEHGKNLMTRMRTVSALALFVAIVSAVVFALDEKNGSRPRDKPTELMTLQP